MASLLNIAYPMINGHRYSFASVQAIFNGIPIAGITSLNYSDELAPAKVYGTDPNPIGRTRGKRSMTADCEMYKKEWNLLMETLAPLGIGYGEVSWDIFAQHSELPMDPIVITDSILGVRITKVEESKSEGAEPLKVKLTLDPMIILLNGAPIVSPFGALG